MNVLSLFAGIGNLEYGLEQAGMTTVGQVEIDPFCRRVLVRPRFVIVENVPPLLRDAEAFGWVLSDLHRLGFDADWSVVSACSVGAPHVRRRLFLVAYANGGDGETGVGPVLHRSTPDEFRHDRARSWRDRCDWAVETADLDGRNADGDAGRLVKAGGNAVVPQISEYIGRLLAGVA